MEDGEVGLIRVLQKAKWLTFGRISRPARGIVAAIYSAWRACRRVAGC
jgi:hypothetical protein